MKKSILIITLFACIAPVGAADLATQEQIQELQDRTNEHRKNVGRLYDEWYSAPLHMLWTSTKAATLLKERWAKNPNSKKDIMPFIKKYNVNTDEFVNPVESFNTFNEFFIRKLKPEARPISSDPKAIVSPADGAILVMQNIGENTPFPIKGTTLSLSKLLVDAKMAKKFEGGTAYVVRLAEWNYHRFHFPLSGIPGETIRIKGRYESVSPLVYERGIQPLELNERRIIRLRPDNTSTVGIVLVGAVYIGSIITTYAPLEHVKKGDEMGYFEYGGSSMVLLFQKDTIQVHPQLLKNSAKGIETPVLMGQPIGWIISD